MAAHSTMSSDRNQRWKYHVFLSFRGTDTRNNFTDHLFEALKSRGFIIFKDDEELPGGEVISEELEKAIEESLISIVILSKNYASSPWCLNELLKILESRERFSRKVFPIFYGVDTSTVRHQIGDFRKAFEKHEERFRDAPEKIQRWRDALKEVAGLFGQDSKNLRETELIGKIVEEVWKKLQPELPTFNNGLVGLDSKIANMYSLLRMELDDVRFIGIWGMGGIGKTTLATEVFNKNRSQFENCCFLANIRDVSDERGHGLVRLQRELLSCLKIEGMKIENTEQGKDTIRSLLCNRKVLLILDDVSSVSQIESLAGNEEWFGPGSRIIVTTRDSHILTSHGISTTYSIGILNKVESFQLFCQKAFKRDHSMEGYFGLSESMVQYAGGLPLALKVLGSFLCGRSIPEWKDTLDMLKQGPQDDVLKTLRLSYEGLEDTYKTIFLDVACFFKGWDRDHVTHILQICGRKPKIGIEVLIEKSLVTCNGRCLEMHDLLQDMGKRILHESSNDAGERSRLWSMEDIDHVLTKNKGSKAIQGIVLNLLEPYEVHWNPKAFSKMCNLKVLILKANLHLSNGLNCLSDGLRVLEWESCPLDSMPLVIQLNDLVDLKLHHSKIKQLWDGIKVFQKLMLIDLSHSKYLIETPDVSGVPHLETLILEGCINLVEVHQSVQQHKKLVTLNLKDCLNLKILPKKLEMNSLEELILSSCLKVKKLPEFGHNMKCLSMLHLNDCINLVCLPDTIRNLKSLKILNISGCLKVSRIPNNLNENETLEEFDASETAIREVPSSVVHLKNLRKLSFRGCKGSRSNSWDLSLPFRWFQKFRRHQNAMGLMLPSISQMSMLSELNLSYCNLGDGSILDDLGRLSSLWKLDLSGNNFVNLPTHSIANLSMLYILKVNDCARLQSLPILPQCLRWLYVNHCARLQSLPILPQCLGWLDVNHCARLQSLPILPQCLGWLDVNHCARLQSLPILPQCLRWLDVNHCARLQSLPILPQCLEYFDVNDCARLQSLPIFPQWLSQLSARNCTSMEFESYSQQPCDFLKSQYYETGQFMARFFISVSEIPTWFDNQNYCSMDFLISAFPELSHFDSIVSIIVDIPDHCRSSKSWEIVACLVLERTTSSLKQGAISWTWKALEADYRKSLNSLFGGFVPEFNGPHLCVMFCSNFTYANEKNLIDDKNQLELLLCSSQTQTSGEEDVKLKIRKCGYRLVWKDNVESTEIAFDKQSPDGSEEDDAAVSNPRPSKRGKLD